MEIKTQDYKTSYDVNTETITFEGTLRLSSMEEYEPIVQLLNSVVEQALPMITLNLQKLEFLNSSGINMLSKFVIKVRQQGKTKLTVQGSSQFPWQSKSLKNLQRLMPSLELEIG